MNNRNKIKILLAGAIVPFAACLANASPITVTETGIGANDTVDITSSTLGALQVYSGIVDLTLTQGTQTSDAVAFCIDPWHMSLTGPQSYSVVALANAPKAPGPMSAAAAAQIGQLWSQYMTSNYALSTNANTADTWAAALQLAIWQTVSASVTNGATFSAGTVTDGFSGEASAVLAAEGTMNSFLAANPDATGTALVGLTGPGQDYVVAAGDVSIDTTQNTSPVPDSGATAVLLGMGLLAVLAYLRRAASVGECFAGSSS